jgi:energy-coupling factor transporter ATP-binding protein EcfA2
VPSLDVVVETKLSRSSRARQLEGMFDVPSSEASRLEWKFDAPIEDKPWSVGLIVGPSGSGKSTVARYLFPGLLDRQTTWNGASVIDDFDRRHSMADIAAACQSVGFNTIPAWLRPFSVLSNGEQFRATLARRMLDEDLIVFDEFTSVVDRQIAKIASHAVQKQIRRQSKQFVAVSCHYDIEEWLQPDWVIEPASGSFTWRSVQSRPKLEITVSPAPYAAWSMFAPFHYLTSELNRAARCWVAFVDDRPAAFAGMLFRPRSTRNDNEEIMGCSRLVCLPDFQGMGIAMALIDRVAAIYGGVGRRTRTYPAHPSLIRSFDRSKHWAMTKRPGVFSSKVGSTGVFDSSGGRPNATFEYVGPRATEAEARKMLRYWNKDGA